MLAASCCLEGMVEASAHQPNPYDANALNPHITPLLPLSVPLVEDD
jgi:hypothetical protein